VNGVRAGQRPVAGTISTSSLRVRPARVNSVNTAADLGFRLSSSVSLRHGLPTSVTELGAPPA